MGYVVAATMTSTFGLQNGTLNNPQFLLLPSCVHFPGQILAALVYYFY
jgi:hypothetical protein